MTSWSDDHLARYATRSPCDGARRHLEPNDPLRGPFELDRHRIIESTSFRRLEYKTQVFAPSLHDHFRTRLTHTLEVAQIARCLAVHLGANEALCEAITLAHDLGHPPFGHAGETALDEAMADQGGFNHNVHSLRVVEYLEHPFPAFRGLNLTLETLSGLSTHATRYDRPGAASRDPVSRVEESCHSLTDRPASDLNRPPFKGGPQGVKMLDGTVGPSVEAQVASLADRIAYNIHDLEDAIGAGLIQLADLDSLSVWHDAFESCVQGASVNSVHAVRRLVLDIILDRIVSDAVQASRAALAEIDSPESTHASTRPLVFLSASSDAQLGELEGFLLERVYRHLDVARTDSEARGMVHVLFDVYLRNPDLLPGRFASRIADQGPKRVICDYIAGMTDRFCTAESQRIENSRSARLKSAH